MKNAATIHRSMLRHQRAIKRVKDGLKQLLIDLPIPSKESGIVQIAPNCCSVSSKSLLSGFNLSPSSYNFNAQYAALAALVQKARPETMMKVLLDALDRKQVQCFAYADDGKTWRWYKGSESKENITLHPEVIANVLTMLEYKGKPTIMVEISLNHSNLGCFGSKIRRMVPAGFFTKWSYEKRKDLLDRLCKQHGGWGSVRETPEQNAARLAAKKVKYLLTTLH